MLSRHLLSREASIHQIGLIILLLNSLGLMRAKLNNKWLLTPLQSAHLGNTGSARGGSSWVALAEMTFRHQEGASFSSEVWLMLWLMEWKMIVKSMMYPAPHHRPPPHHCPPPTHTHTQEWISRGSTSRTLQNFLGRYARAETHLGGTCDVLDKE